MVKERKNVETFKKHLDKQKDQGASHFARTKTIKQQKDPSSGSKGKKLRFPDDFVPAVLTSEIVI